MGLFLNAFHLYTFAWTTISFCLWLFREGSDFVFLQQLNIATGTLGHNCNNPVMSIGLVHTVEIVFFSVLDTYDLENDSCALLNVWQ